MAYMAYEVYHFSLYRREESVDFRRYREKVSYSSTAPYREERVDAKDFLFLDE